jgi:hypothetical protein
MACGWKGHSNICEGLALSERSRAKTLQPVILSDLQGKGWCGKEAFLLT